MALIFLSLVALASAQITPQEIIEIGKALHTAIEDNQAVLDVSTDWAAAVPDGITDWQTLTNWESPVQSSSFYIEFKNFLGMKLTRFEWKFAWKYGGSYNGVGQYVTQAGIQLLDAYAYTSEHLRRVSDKLEASELRNLLCSNRWSGRDGFRHFAWFVRENNQELHHDRQGRRIFEYWSM